MIMVMRTVVAWMMIKPEVTLVPEIGHMWSTNLAHLKLDNVAVKIFPATESSELFKLAI